MTIHVQYVCVESVYFIKMYVINKPFRYWLHKCTIFQSSKDGYNLNSFKYSLFLIIRFAKINVTEYVL